MHSDRKVLIFTGEENITSKSGPLGPPDFQFINKSLKTKRGRGWVGKVWLDPGGDKVAPDRGEVPGEP